MLTVVGTIGGTIRMGHGLWVHCENRECLHRARIDLEAIAEYYGVDSTPVRLLWVILSIMFGACIGGVVAYLVAWLIIPAPSVSSLTTASPAAPAA